MTDGRSSPEREREREYEYEEEDEADDEDEDEDEDEEAEVDRLQGRLSRRQYQELCQLLEPGGDFGWDIVLGGGIDDIADSFRFCVRVILPRLFARIEVGFLQKKIDGAGGAFPVNIAFGSNRTNVAAHLHRVAAGIVADFDVYGIADINEALPEMFLRETMEHVAEIGLEVSVSLESCWSPPFVGVLPTDIMNAVACSISQHMRNDCTIFLLSSCDDVCKFGTTYLLASLAFFKYMVVPLD